MILATSKPQIYAKQILKHFELAEYFDDIQGSSMDGSKIHKEDVIQSALSDNQITDMQEVLMIGDRKHDVLGSGKFGISCVGVLYGYGSREELETCRCKMESWIRSKTSKLFWSVSERGRKCRIKQKKRKAADQRFWRMTGFTLASEPLRRLLWKKAYRSCLPGIWSGCVTALHFFGIDQSVEEQEVLAYLNASPQSEEKQHGALKITVTAQNKLFGLRKNTYSEEQYQKGFRLGFSEIRRNETSPLTYHKTLGIADNIMEKRNAKKAGWMKRFFSNQKGQISEGCTTNIFFIQDDKLVTPPVSSGMLPGVMRRYVIKEAGRRGVLLEEKELYPEDISKFNGCFVTNSLLGMMPAASFGEQKFDTAKVLHFIEQIL